MNMLTETESFVSELLTNKIPYEYSYHNIDHTKEVVSAVQIIGKSCNLCTEDIYTLILAAWFHDAGYIHTYHKHEEASKKIASTYLKIKNFDKAFIKRVMLYIGYTNIKLTPFDKLSGILRDADLYNLSQKDFLKKALMLKYEWNSVLKRNYQQNTFWENTFHFMNKHKYYSDYGQGVLTKGKIANLALLYNILSEGQINHIEKQLLYQNI